MNAGTISAGDNRISVPASVTVPANGSTTLTVTVSCGRQRHSVQGWINLDGAWQQRSAFRLLRPRRSRKESNREVILPNRDAGNRVPVFFRANTRASTNPHHFG